MKRVPVWLIFVLILVVAMAYGGQFGERLSERAPALQVQDASSDPVGTASLGVSTPEMRLERPESVEVAHTQRRLPRDEEHELPPELQGPPDADDFDRGWSGMPIAPNLKVWMSEAESDPNKLLRLIDSLRRCVLVRGTSVESVVEIWRHSVDLASSRTNTRPEARASTLRGLANDARKTLQTLRDCQGGEDPVGVYLRALERAAREHPDPEQRNRSRIQFIHDAFVDMPSASLRIGSIDEVMRRRDIAVAWLIELRDQGNLDAIRAYAFERGGRTGLLATDRMEYHAWDFVGRVRQRVELESRPGLHSLSGQPSAVEIWRTGPQPSRYEAIEPEQVSEAHSRGREIYQRLFGAPPG